MEYDHKNVAKTLRLLMNCTGISQAELSRGAGLSPVLVSNLLNEKACNPTARTIFKLCDYFNVTPNYLLRYESKNELGSTVKKDHVMYGLRGIARAAILVRKVEHACIDANIDGGVIYDIASHLENAFGYISADASAVKGAKLPELEKSLYDESMTADEMAAYIYNQIKEA